MKTLVHISECKFCIVARPSRLRKNSLVSQPCWTRVIWYLWMSRMNRASWHTFPHCTITLATLTLQVIRKTNNLGGIEAILAYRIDIARPFSSSLAQMSCFERHIFGDPGTTSRDDVIFSGKSLLQGLKSPWKLILSEPVPEVVEFRPADWAEKKIFFCPISDEV